MGGFARYPWPQYISNPPFYYNKNYKRAMAFAVFGAFVNGLWAIRFFSYHTVLLYLAKMVNPGYGSWIDPENPHAPQ
jgi:hypothetical protein